MQLSTQVTATMSSREIAELTGKQHQHVKRDIESMLKDLEKDASSFGHIYLDSMNRQQTEYLLDKEYTECLITGYSAVLRMKVIKRLHELEEKTQLPTDYLSALKALTVEVEERQKLEQTLAIAAPKAQFVDSYVTATGLMGFREAAKLLKVKESDFREFLIENKIMYRLAGKMSPYSQHLDAGRFEVKTGENQSNGQAFTQAKFTPKGIEWVAGLLAVAAIRGDK